MDTRSETRAIVTRFSKRRFTGLCTPGNKYPHRLHAGSDSACGAPQLGHVFIKYSPIQTLCEIVELIAI